MAQSLSWDEEKRDFHKCVKAIHYKYKSLLHSTIYLFENVGVEWLSCFIFISWNLLRIQRKKEEDFLFIFSHCFFTGKQEMSNSMQTDKRFVKFLTLFVLIYTVHQGESHITELLFEEEDSPAAVAANLNQILPSAHAAALPPMVEDNMCHVEFTVLKRAVGRCIKLGKATRACVSGTYIHPFHPDCM